jgi:hypothetical protein
MSRWIAVVLGCLLTFAFVAFPACGDDDDAPAERSPDRGGSPAASPGDPITPVDESGLAQPTADQGLPPISPAAEDDLAINVSTAAGSVYAPTVAEFRQLTTTTIEAGGPKTGVLLSTIAAQVSAAEGSLVTIEGRQPNADRGGQIRYALSEIGSSTVLILDGEGHVALASSAIPGEQWLLAITNISFQ